MARYVILKDKNLKPENIKSGVKIFKVEGTYEGGGGEGEWDWVAQLKRHEIQLNGEDWESQLEDLTNLSFEEYGSMALTAGPDVFDDGYDRVLDYDFTNGGMDATADHGLAYALAGTSVQRAVIDVQNRPNAHSCWEGMFYECPDIQEVTVTMNDSGPTPYTDGQGPRLFERFMMNAGGQIDSNDTIMVEFPDLTWVNSRMFYEAFSNLGYNSESRRYCNIVFPDLQVIGWIARANYEYKWLFDINPSNSNQVAVSAFYKAFSNCQTKTSSRSGAKAPVLPQSVNDIFPSLKGIVEGNAVFSYAFAGTNITDANFDQLDVIDYDTNSGTFGVFEGAFENSAIETITCRAIYGENADNPDTWRDAFKNTSLVAVYASPDMLSDLGNCKNMLWGLSEERHEAGSEVQLGTMEVNIPVIAYDYVDKTDPQDFDENKLLQWLQIKNLNIPGNVLSYSCLIDLLDSVKEWLNTVNDDFGEYYSDPLEWWQVMQAGNEINFTDVQGEPLIVQYLNDNPTEEDIQAVKDRIDELTSYGFYITGIYMTEAEYILSRSQGAQGYQDVYGAYNNGNGQVALDYEVTDEITSVHGEFRHLVIYDGYQEDYFLRLFGNYDGGIGYGFEAKIVNNDLIFHVFDAEVVFPGIITYIWNSEFGNWDVSDVVFDMSFDLNNEEVTIDLNEDFNNLSETVGFSYSDPVDDIALLGCIEGTLEGQTCGEVGFSNFTLRYVHDEYFEDYEDTLTVEDVTTFTPCRHGYIVDQAGLMQYSGDNAAVKRNHTVGYYYQGMNDLIYADANFSVIEPEGEYRDNLMVYDAPTGGDDWLVKAASEEATQLWSYSMPLPPIGRNYYYYRFFEGNQSIETTPRMVGVNSTDVSANFAMANMFKDCTNLTYADLSNITSVSGNEACGRMFYGCSNLESVDLSSFRGTIGDTSCWVDTFTGCDNLLDMKIHAEGLRNGAVGSNPMQTAVNIENLTVTGETRHNVRLEQQPNLTAESVLSVLTHLSSTPGANAQVRFYNGGLTVTDDAQGSIQAARDAAVTNGWTIIHLTITPDPGR